MRMFTIRKSLGKWRSMTDIGKMYAKIAKENRPNCATSGIDKQTQHRRMLAVAMIQNRRRNIKNSTAQVKTQSGVISFIALLFLTLDSAMLKLVDTTRK